MDHVKMLKSNQELTYKQSVDLDVFLTFLKNLMLSKSQS